MNITVIGAGYVGLTITACFAGNGHIVMCCDNNEQKVDQLQRRNYPVFEDKLSEYLNRFQDNCTVRFTDDSRRAISFGEIIFVAVGTPETAQGIPDMTQLLQVAALLGTYLEEKQLVVIRSTLPVGGTTRVENEIICTLKLAGRDFSPAIIYQPEFLSEGTAIYDFIHPSRTVIGMNDYSHAELLWAVYTETFHFDSPVVFTTPVNAELIKYASNAFLATKIAFINEVADFCEAVDGDVRVVAQGMGMDKRIAPYFLEAGPGYGGACLPKDTKAFCQIAWERGVTLSILAETIKSNERRMKKIALTLAQYLPDCGTVGVLGLSFKEGSDDIRQSPAILIIQNMAELCDYEFRLFDPKAMDNAGQVLCGHRFILCEDMTDVADGADILLVATAWEVFRDLPLEQMKYKMRGSHLFDLRNLYHSEFIETFGYIYHGIGW